MRFHAPPDLPSLAIANGATLPVPADGAGGLAWSTTESAVVVFNGTSWDVLAAGTTIHSARLDTAVSQLVPSTSLTSDLTVSTPLVSISALDGQDDTYVEVTGEHLFAGVRFADSAGSASITGSQSIAYVAGDNSTADQALVIGSRSTATRESATDIMDTVGDMLMVGTMSNVYHGFALNAAAVTDVAYGSLSRVGGLSGTIVNAAGHKVEVTAYSSGSVAAITSARGIWTSGVAIKAGASAATIGTYVDIYAEGASAVGGATVPVRYGFHQVAVDHMNVFAGPLVAAQVIETQAAPATCSATTTLTIANLLTRVITFTGGSAATLTLPTGTNADYDTGTGVALPDNTGFDWTVINTGTAAATLAGSTGHTIIGQTAIPAGSSATFRSRKTAANTFVTYTIADAASSGSGAATIDFGAAPGSTEASVTFASVAIGAGAIARAFIMADDTTADHTASDHRYAAALVGLSVSVDAGVGGTIYARSQYDLTGQFAVRWQWNN